MSENKTKKLFDSITNIGDDIIEEAQATTAKKKASAWMKWSAMVACLCLVVAVVPVVLHTINPQNDLKGLEISENFLYEGVEYYIIGDDDSPEHYGFPAKITGELAGEQNAYLLRDENNDLFVTEKKSDIVVFDLKNLLLELKLYQYEFDWINIALIDQNNS